MAEQAFLNALQGLTSKMDNLNQMLASGHIKPFSWDPKLFKTWIKFALLERVTPYKLKLVAFKASTGAVSDFIQIFKWRTKCTMGRTENRARSKIRRNQWISTLFYDIETRQINRKWKCSDICWETTFSRGKGPRRHSEFLLMVYIPTVMHDNPTTMTAAINSARLEFALQQRFKLRTCRNYFAPQSFRGDPMEIDHYRPKGNKRPLSGTKPPPRPKHQKVSAVEVRYNKEIVCWNCHKKGHIRHKLSLP